MVSGNSGFVSGSVFDVFARETRTPAFICLHKDWERRVTGFRVVPVVVAEWEALKSEILRPEVT